MNYPFPTFCDNAATLRPLPAIVDQFVSGHSHREDVTLTVAVVLPAMRVVQPGGVVRSVIAFPERPSAASWESALAAAATAANDLETMRFLDASEMKGLNDLV